MVELRGPQGKVEQTAWLSIGNCMVESRGPQGKVQGSPGLSSGVSTVKF